MAITAQERTRLLNLLVLARKRKAQLQHQNAPPVAPPQPPPQSVVQRTPY